MKNVLRMLLAVVLGCIAFGYYRNYGNAGSGEKYIGVGVLLFAFILMPLFIYHRYKDKDLSRYSFKNQSEERKKDD